METDMKLLIIRHAEAESNVRKTVSGGLSDRLTQKGLDQSFYASEILKSKNINPEIIYCSEMLRAKHTASCLFSNVPFISDFRLNETDCGDVTDWARAEFDTRYPEFWAPFSEHHCFPGGESHAQMAKRACAAFNEIISDNLEKNTVAIVSHLGPINAILHQMFNVPLVNFPAFSFTNLALASFEFKRGSLMPRINYLNKPLIDWGDKW